MRILSTRFHGSRAFNSFWLILPILLWITPSLTTGIFSPRAETTLPGAVKPSGPPVTLSIQALKTMYTQREGIAVQFLLKAKHPTKLCLEKDPFSQFQLQINKGGAGIVKLDPLVLQDNRELFYEKIRIIELEAGDTYPIRANLKRLTFSNGEKWTPGDYTFSAVFNLCDQTEGLTSDSSGKEIPIKSSNSGSFMILE